MAVSQSFKTIDDLEQGFGIQIVATYFRGRTYIAPARHVEITAPARLGVIAEPEALENSLEKLGLRETRDLEVFVEALGPGKSGIAG